jgi:hypothetical protein
MGRYNSVTGTAVGKVSSAVFYRLNGQEVIRGIGEKKNSNQKRFLHKMTASGC